MAADTEPSPGMETWPGFRGGTIWLYCYGVSNIINNKWYPKWLLYRMWRGGGDTESPAVFWWPAPLTRRQAGSWAACRRTTPFMLDLDTQKGHIQEERWLVKLTITMARWPIHQSAMYNCTMQCKCVSCIVKLRQGSAREWPLRRKASKLQPLPRAYIKVGCHHHHPPDV